MDRWQTLSDGRERAEAKNELQMQRAREVEAEELKKLKELDKQKEQKEQKEM